MKLKVFVPDWDAEQINRYCTPLLYPFLQPELPLQALTEKYGDWIHDIIIVHHLQDCDIAVLKYDISYYYTFKKIATLHSINKQTAVAGKLLICTAKGDAGVTPPLYHFHLYRWGGYASKNGGNQFIMPVFIPDPLPLYNEGCLSIHEQKSNQPIIGFYGQGRGGLLKWSKDIARGIYNRSMRLTGKRFYDDEELRSSTYIRSQLLDALEKSPLVQTQFVRYTKYRNGVTSKEERKAAAKPFFKNILATQYTVCYRGAGNFSVRLFETMACGRIPVLVMSDNLLPSPHKIYWNKFPVIPSSEKGRIAQKIAAFHSSLSPEAFVQLQQYARQVWEQYLSYSGFMRTTFDSYKKNTAAQPHSSK